MDDGVFDGAQETDGIEAFNLPLGPNYPSGIFICQDGFNYDGATKAAQNFKLVSWSKISDAFLD